MKQDKYIGFINLPLGSSRAVSYLSSKAFSDNRAVFMHYIIENMTRGKEKGLTNVEGLILRVASMPIRPALVSIHKALMTPY